MHYLCLIALEVLNVTVHLSREKPIFKFKSSIFFNNCCKTFRDFLYPKKDLFNVSPSKFTGQYCGLCDINQYFLYFTLQYDTLYIDSTAKVQVTYATDMEFHRNKTVKFPSQVIYMSYKKGMKKPITRQTTLQMTFKRQKTKGKLELIKLMTCRIKIYWRL